MRGWSVRQCWQRRRYDHLYPGQNEKKAISRTTHLYGCRVWGFDAPGKEYFSIIGNLVNMKMQYDSSVKAYIEIVLLFDDGKERNTIFLKKSNSIIGS